MTGGLELMGYGVWLRQFEPHDVAPLTRALADPLIARYTRWPLRPSEQAVARLFRDANDEAAGRRRVELAITPGSLAAAVGSAGVEVDPSGESVEVFYWLDARARGESYVTRAIDLLSEYSCSEMAVHGVRAVVHPRNASSKRVLARCGFALVGRTEDGALEFLRTGNLRR